MLKTKINKLHGLLKGRISDDAWQKIITAWEFGQRVHHGQVRKTGEAYAFHGLETAIILAGWGLDSVSIQAGILHDVIEDAGVTKEELAKLFGKNVANIVDGVTKVSKVRLRGSKEALFVENLRKMFMAMSKDIRVVLVKLADRTHNMRTLYALGNSDRLRIAKETIEIYAPLAERLGMGEVKGELEDLAFIYLDLEGYKRIRNESKPYFHRAETVINKMRKRILKDMGENKLEAKINTRKKHLYSLWKKVQRDEIDWDFTKVHDIVAMRIIVARVEDCYASLGIVHSLYKPVPRVGVSDFIAQPKPNGYQSIHSKVFGPRGRIVEIQIRTFKMHEEAEHGVAAHWAYSEAKSKGMGDFILQKKGVVAGNKMSWVKNLIDWQKDIVDTGDYLKAIKLDVLRHRNFVFSPQGDVYDLPTGATPIDFAFAVHTHLGRYIKAAKVNGKIVPLNYQLKSGDMVEIIKTKNPIKPNKDWLTFVTTLIAKREIARNNPNN